MRFETLVLLTLATSSFLFAETKVDNAAVAQANNPLANMKALNFHNYYMGELTESDESADQLWVRYVQPFSLGETNWLMRASLPLNSFPVGTNGATKRGLGDFNILAVYLVDMGIPAVSFGVGPLLTLPTATEERLGSKKYSAGIANVLFNARSRLFQYGYLLTWQHSFAGDADRDTVNIAAFQPFALLQLGGGTYLRSVGIWHYEIEHDRYSIPIGLGVGQVIKMEKTVFNVFIEPQYSVADKGANIAQWQVFTGLNIQFYGQ